MNKLGIVLLLLVTLSCAEGPAGPAQTSHEQTPVAEPELNAVPNPVVQSARGGGTSENGRGVSGRTLSFRATKRSDGTVAGLWQSIEHGDLADETFIEHGIVTCLTIVGANEAYVGGRVTNSRATGGRGPGIHEGMDVVFWVKDNGVGRPPDYFSGPGFKAAGGAEAWCASTPTIPTIGFPGEIEGNFVVIP
ncbi:MAG: hypothetical protein ACC682_15970 [Gemmatimonadota bacterium]